VRLKRQARPKSNTLRPALGYLAPAEGAARALGHNYVGTEHILLGLLERQGGMASVALERFGTSPDKIRDRLLAKLHPPEPRLDPRALATLGIDLDQVRARVEEAFGPGSLELGPTRCMRIAPRAKLALAYAVDEARGAPVNDSHVLIGLLSVSDCLAARVLAELGVSLSRVRVALKV
jgi:ATP-dependent Clp protease ATP-binding subunit ClpA